MNEKEVSEIRRRFRTDKSNINHVRGIFVNEKREIVSEFDQSLGMLSEEEAGAILSVIKKTLSGYIGRNLINIAFSNAQVLDSDEHRLLSSLRSSELRDNTAVHEFYNKILPTVTIEGNYLILLAYDSYDVFSHSSDGEKDDSSEAFSYIICAVCPIKASKSSLTYYIHENRLRNVCEEAVVKSPEFGFMFPAFDERKTNIYNALFYTKSAADNHGDFLSAVFNTPLPMPAEEQRETFNSILAETVAEECSLDVVESVHAEISDMMENHGNTNDDEPLTITKTTVKEILRSCGVSDKKLEDFDKKYDESFGENTALSPQNIIDKSSFNLRTADAMIKIDPERSDVVETRVIDGMKYILIRADSNVEVNGVNIKIKNEGDSSK